MAERSPTPPMSPPTATLTTSPTTSTLKALGSDLWSVDDSMKVPGGQLLLRMTVAKLADGSVWIHSPIPLSDELVRSIEALGPVGHIVAPNKFHHMFVRPWVERFPRARLYGAAGLAEKRKDLQFHEVLGSETPAAWRADFDQVAIAGAPVMNEVAFFHRGSRTLVLLDLVFNVQSPQGFLMHVAFALMGTRKRFTTSRTLRLFVKDKAAFLASIQTIMGWDFRRVSMAHGELVEGDDVKERFRAALSKWVK